MRLSEWREVEEIRGDRSQYRPRTAALLRKYFKLSVEVGRLPSLIGREFFRPQVTDYTTCTFEDTVIFVHDMERSLELLDPHSQAIVARIFFQQYTYDEAVDLFHISRRSVARSVAAALDALSGILLERGLLRYTNDPISLSQVKRGKQLEPPKKPPVSVRFLMRLRYAKYCQAPSLQKMRLNY
jgi:hypothetical protein